MDIVEHAERIIDRVNCGANTLDVIELLEEYEKDWRIENDSLNFIIKSLSAKNQGLEQDNERMVKQINKMAEDIEAVRRDLRNCRSGHDALHKPIFK